MPRTLVLLGLGLVVAVAVWFALGAPSGGDGPVLAPPSGASAPAVAANGTVVRVVDGDTVQLALEGGTETVRLIGVDTPETVDERKPVQCYGPEASAHTKALLPPGTAVRVERDAEARDQYGRLLAYVHRAADGLFVNLELVEDGYGVVLSIAPNTTHVAAFRAAEAAARQAGLGLWGTCGGPGKAAASSTTVGK
jgi:micrococcal nuclease